MYDYRELLREGIQDRISQHGGKPAYVINGNETSYAEMDHMADNVASYIVDQLPSDAVERELPVRIGVMLPRDSHFISCIWALTKLGATYVPIDVNTPQERLKLISDDCSLDFLITSDNLPGILSYKGKAELPELGKSLSEAYIIYTSGTTGVPKGISQTPRTIYNYISRAMQPEDMHVTESSRVLMFASINFDVSIMEVFLPLFAGATIVVAQDEDKYDVSRLYRLLKNSEITFCYLPPSMLSMFPDFNLPKMETLSAGGEAIPNSLTARIVGKYPFRFVNGYGPAESFYATTYVYTDPERWACIGKPVPGVVGYVVDSEMHVVKPGEKGELLLGGAQLCNGYWNRPELNKTKFFDNPFPETREIAPRLYHSGDIVKLNADGSYDFIGRKDSMVKLHGFRIELEEVNTRLESHPDVRRAFTRIEELGNDKYLVTYICADKSTDISAIREYLSRYVPKYMIPTFWNRVDAFQLNINGKIDKTKLVNVAWNECHYNTRTPSSNERIMISAVSNIIGADDVNLDADLVTEVGLTSLQIMQLPQDVELCGLHITVEDIYQHRTISKIIENHLYRLSFWYNNPEEQPEKPVIIIVCGHAHFGFYEDFFNLIKDKYNLFVIESFHAILCLENCTAPVLNEIYKLIVKPIEAKYNVIAYVGYCLGGEQALCMAHDLHNDTEKKPHVIVLDGEVLRDKDPEHFIPLRLPALNEKQNHKRWLIDTTLVSTIPDEKVYNGPVTSFLTKYFEEQLTFIPEDTANTPKEKIERYRERFNIAPQLWRQVYPQAHIEMLEGSHFTCMHDPDCLKVMADYVNSLC